MNKLGKPAAWAAMALLLVFAVCGETAPDLHFTHFTIANPCRGKGMAPADLRWPILTWMATWTSSPANRKTTTNALFPE